MPVKYPYELQYLSWQSYPVVLSILFWIGHYVLPYCSSLHQAFKWPGIWTSRLIALIGNTISTPAVESKAGYDRSITSSRDVSIEAASRYTPCLSILYRAVK